MIPGVSGGTTALLLGIYFELISALKSLSSAPFLTALRRLELRTAFRAANGTFLLTILAGIATAILTLAHSLSWLLEHRPVLVAAFFFGLVLASVLVVARRVKRWTAPALLAFTLGMLAAWLVAGSVPLHTPDAWWFLLLSGALAVCALLLPGVSGAFVLLLLGKYDFALQAVRTADLPALGLLISGGVLGVLSFSRLLTWLFTRYHDLTIALLSGLMLGSLRRLWPWRSETSGRVLNELPAGPLFDPVAGTAWALLLLLSAVLLVLLLERTGRTASALE